MHASAPPQKVTRSSTAGFGIALLSVTAAFLATLLLQPLFPYPFLFLFFGAVMASAWFGGTAAGLFAVLISTVEIDYCFLPPFYSFSLSATVEAYFAAFIACALVASWISSSKKKSEEALRETRDQLEIRVSERTAELMKTQAELEHLSRAMSIGELTASIAHEISQPLTAVVAHGNACVEWLSATPPNLERARQTADRIVRDGTQAGAVLSRIRGLFKKEAPTKDWFDMNEVIYELTIFLREEAMRRRILMHTELASELPKIKADRVQVQQVMLNLLMNGMDAMAEITGHSRDLLITSREENSAVLVGVEDCGAGLDGETAKKIFEPFFTTKPHGIGLGLSISRSIVESHEGHLWALPRPSGGAIFQFTLPIHPRDSDG